MQAVLDLPKGSWSALPVHPDRPLQAPRTVTPAFGDCSRWRVRATATVTEGRTDFPEHLAGTRSYMTLINSDRTPHALAGATANSLPVDTEQLDPLSLFGAWFQQASDTGLHLPEAMTLATCTPSGHPSARMVLLKQFDARGFVFYTNFDSRKSQELSQNPRAALVLHWAVLERQVRIEGTVAKVDPEEAIAYFRTRPRDSRIGAWASIQSTRLPARSILETRVQEVEQRFRDQEVPLPPFWGGWRVMPTRIEFWQGQPDRLHDRLIFVKSGCTWQAHRLYP